MAVQSFRDLIVWQKAVELTREVYLLSSYLPPQERFGLASQMQRAVVAAYVAQAD
jgi:four helix bundle protein